MSKGKVLVIGSNATRLEARGGGTITIGQFLNETAVPLMALIEANYDIVLATPSGQKPHMDKDSDALLYFGGDEAAHQRAKNFFVDDPSMNRVRTLQSVIDEGLGGYAGLYFPGGHAPVVDLMQSPEVGEILRYFHDKQKPTAALCHGPMAILAAMDGAREFRAALLAGDTDRAAKLASGWPYAGYRMTVFSRSEETFAEEQVFHAKLHFNMPDALEVAGAEVVTGPVDFKSHVVEDRELVTGQNPRSDHALAAKFIQALERSASAR
jgi:putative intracellular protease/amidase